MLSAGAEGSISSFAFFASREYTSSYRPYLYVQYTPPAPVETISPPTSILGNQATYTNTSNSYTASGASSNLGHSIEYRFNWGDGSPLSSWGKAPQSHSWGTAGDYYVDAQARCSTDTGKVSTWPGINWNVTVLNPPPQPDLVSVSGVPSSVGIGQSFTVTITAKNNGGQTSEGAVHAAVRYSDGTHNEDVSELSDVSWAILSPKHYAPGESGTVIFNKGSSTPRGYPPADWLLEAWNTWSNGVQHSMTFTVTPNKTGTLKILVRTTMNTGPGVND